MRGPMIEQVGGQIEGIAGRAEKVFCSTEPAGALVSPVRAACLMIGLLITAYSLAPFAIPYHDDTLASRLDRFFQFPGTRIRTWVGPLAHLCAFLALGACAAAGAGRAKAGAVFLLFLPLVVFIEAYQLFVPSRHAQLADLLANSTGMAVGAALGVRLRGRFEGLNRAYARLERRIHVFLFSLTIVAWLALLVLPAMNLLSLATWDPSYPLLVGNEVGGGRPWTGELRYVAFYDRALTPADVSARRVDLAEGRPASDAPLQALLAAYDFRVASGEVIQASGPVTAPPLIIRDPAACEWRPGVGGLVLRGPVVLSTDEPPRELVAAMAATGAFSVEAWFRPESLSQRGPARIVSVSRGVSNRSFTLGQEHDELVFRVRTGVSGPNGSYPALEAGSSRLTTNLHHVVATYANGVSRLYLDGKPLPSELDLHAPGPVLQLGGSVASQAAAAMLCVLPLVLSGYVIFAGGQRYRPAILSFAAMTGVIATGWAARYLAVGHRPDWETAAWVVLAWVVLYPAVVLICVRPRPRVPAAMGVEPGPRVAT
jgi:VanZ family protein